MESNSFDRLIQLMEEQLRWTKAVAAPQVRASLTTILKEDSDKIVYELTDGQRSIRDIERITKISRSKIWKLWTKWETNGIAERIASSGTARVKHSFSLTNLGVELPEIPELRNEDEQMENEIQ